MIYGAPFQPIRDHLWTGYTVLTYIKTRHAIHTANTAAITASTTGRGFSGRTGSPSGAKRGAEAAEAARAASRLRPTFLEGFAPDDVPRPPAPIITGNYSAPHAI